MSLEGFVRASGAVMGSAREAFGPGGAAVPARGGVGVLPGGPASASGAAADGFDDETRELGAHVSALSEHDAASETDLAQAVAASGVGRERMDSVIAAAVGDVERLGMSTNTYAGQRALVDAITRRLEESKSTLQQSHSDATTRAASADTTAAGYNGIGAQTTPASMLGAGGMPAGTPSMPMLPSMPMPSGMGMPMMGGGGGLPLAPLTNLASMMRGGAPASGAFADPEGTVRGVLPGATSAAAIPVGDVRYDRLAVPAGREAYRGYFAKALDVMGITDPQARANWIRGLEVGAERESGFRPDAVNRWDSNAHGARMPDGAPANSSRGGLQTIPTTFAANHQPGTSTNIYDPVANAAAAMNYLMRRYHVTRDGSNLSSVGQFNPAHAAGGY